MRRTTFSVDRCSILPVHGFDLCEQDVLLQLSMEKFRFTKFLVELQAEGAREMLKQHVSIFKSYFDYIFLQILELFFFFFLTFECKIHSF